MATRHANLKTLTSPERDEQNKWAQEKIKLIGECVSGFTWWPFDGYQYMYGKKEWMSGYKCWAGGHTISHEQIIEGRGIQDGLLGYGRRSSSPARERGPPEWYKELQRHPEQRPGT